jgi:hypothetical protein
MNPWSRRTGLIPSPPAPHRLVAGARLFARRQPRRVVDYGGRIPWDGKLTLRNAGADGIGDCVPAAHLQLDRMRLLECLGSTWQPTDAMAEALYRDWAGWDGTPATDVGTDVHAALDRWAASGIRLGEQLLDIGQWVALPSDLDVLRAAIDFGVGAVGSVALRESDFDTSRPWLDTTAPSIGAHQVMFRGYDAGAFHAITWDDEAEIPNAALAQRLLAVQVPLSRDLMGATGLTPDGMTWAELLVELERAA